METKTLIKTRNREEMYQISRSLLEQVQDFVESYEEFKFLIEENEDNMTITFKLYR